MKSMTNCAINDQSMTKNFAASRLVIDYSLIRSLKIIMINQHITYGLRIDYLLILLMSSNSCVWSYATKARAVAS